MWEERLRVELQLLRRNGGVRQLVPLEEDEAPYVRILCTRQNLLRSNRLKQIEKL
jgi:hypothetical protein